MLWMNFAVRAGFSWPNVPVEIPYESSTILLSPGTPELACTASIFDATGFEFDEGATRLSRFLSCLAWSMRGGIKIHFAIGSNDPNKPGRLGRGSYGGSGWADVPPWQQLYLPTIPSPKAALAIALFREGLTQDFEPLAFLSFFKVLNVVFPTGADQEAWINKNIGVIRYGRELDRLGQLQKQHQDIGKYLYVQGRCAVAHAFSSPIADPDDYSDYRRLCDDLPLIAAFAESCIEHELGVPTADNFFAKHRNDFELPPEYLIPRTSPTGRVGYQPYSHTSSTE